MKRQRGLGFRTVIGTALVGIVVLAAVIVTTLRTPGGMAATTTHPTLTSVADSALAGAGITLSNPTTSSVVSQAAAKQTAIKLLPTLEPGAKVVEATFAQVHSTGDLAVDGKNLWVVAVMTPGHTHHNLEGQAKPLKFEVIFVDPQTGAFAGQWWAGEE